MLDIILLLLTRWGLGGGGGGGALIVEQLIRFSWIGYLVTSYLVTTALYVKQSVEAEKAIGINF